VSARVAVWPPNEHIAYMDHSKKRSNTPVKPAPSPKPPTVASRRKTHLDELTERQTQEALGNLRRNSLLKTPTN
jgi:hypothetical protein